MALTKLAARMLPVLLGSPIGHVAPPSVVRRSAPVPPTAQAFVAPDAATANRSPVIWFAQVDPPPELPFVVRSSVRPSPAAQPRSAVANAIPLSAFVVELVWAVHGVAPASSVRKIPPPAPTENPSIESTNAMSWSAPPPGLWSVQTPAARSAGRAGDAPAAAASRTKTARHFSGNPRGKRMLVLLSEEALGRRYPSCRWCRR